MPVGCPVPAGPPWRLGQDPGPCVPGELGFTSPVNCPLLCSSGWVWSLSGIPHICQKPCSPHGQQAGQLPQETGLQGCSQAVRGSETQVPAGVQPRNSREPPGRSFLLKSPQWFRTAGLFAAIWQVSLKCQEHLPTPNLHTHPLRGPYGETPWTLQGQPDRWPVPDLPSSGSDLHPALLLVLEPLLPAAFLESRS